MTNWWFSAKVSEQYSSRQTKITTLTCHLITSNCIQGPVLGESLAKPFYQYSDGLILQKLPDFAKSKKNVYLMWPSPKIWRVIVLHVIHINMAHLQIFFLEIAYFMYTIFYSLTSVDLKLWAKPNTRYSPRLIDITSMTSFQACVL